VLLGALQIKIIDFGAACDLATGINFNPLYGMLDPRYSPPEELVMPQGKARSNVIISTSKSQRHQQIDHTDACSAIRCNVCCRCLQQC
jgi:hypothetical protein